jgi:hypothetical protein
MTKATATTRIEGVFVLRLEEMLKASLLVAILAQSSSELGAQRSNVGEAQKLTLSCSSTSNTVEGAIKPGVTLVRMIAPPGAFWRLEELGVDLRVAAPPTSEHIEVGHRPPRLGVSIAEVGTGRAIRISTMAGSGLEAAGLLTLYCKPTPAISTLADCLAASGDQVNAALGSTLDVASTRLCLAIRKHNSAVEAFRGGAIDQAEGLYRLTIEMWLEQGDEARAGAALLGLSETLMRKGRHQGALEQAREGERRSIAGGIEYYALRARAQQCLALRNLGRYREADDCADPLAERYVGLGETSEAANALYTIAAMAREDGDQARARQALQRALQLAETEITDMVAGRLSLIGAGLAADSGHLHAALNLFDDALGRFERVGAPIWMGGAYLGAARLHAALGADAEAATLVAASETQFRKAQAPERLAGALLLRAQIEAARGAPEAAAALADEAEQAYSRGSRPQLRLSAALLGLSVEPSPERAERVRALSGPEVDLPPRAQFDLAAGLAGYALDNGEATTAHRRLEAVAAAIPDVGRGIRFDLLMARADVDQGRPESARHRLNVTIKALRAMAQDAGSPALRQIVGRRLLELRAGWLATLQRNDMGDPGLIQRTMGMIVETQPLALLASSPPVGERSSPDVLSATDLLQHRLATALLGQPDDVSEAMADVQRLLWARYTREGDARAAVLEWPLQQEATLQDELGPDERVLVLGLAEPASVVIVLGSDRLTMHQVAGASVVRRLAHHLVGLASDRDAAVAEIEAAAQELSRSLLPDTAGPAPGRLWIVADETLAAVPFSLLRWKGAEGPLADSSRISVGPILLRSAHPAARSPAPSVEVFTAAAANAATNGLPRLPSAIHEPSWVSQAMGGAAQRAAALDLDVLRRSLAVPGSWIHVAGHGRSRGGLQGYSGLWVDAEPGTVAPRFISWLDLVGAPLRAQLLVLNACDLAATGAGAISRASSFAVALNAAGVDDVVAALWPVSDSAAALWVPAFYEELARQRSDGRYDPAGALAAAQHRLRSSRAFRHPFYWASMVHIAGPATAQTSTAQ